MRLKNIFTAVALSTAVIPALADVTNAQSPEFVSSSQVIEGSFEKALSDMKSGRPESAARTFRRILADNPGLVRVRLELARALFFADELGAAKREFRIVLSRHDIPAPVRQKVLNFMRAIDENRGLQTNFEFSLRAPQGAGRTYTTDELNVDFNGTPLTFTMNRPEIPETGIDISGSVRKQWALWQSPQRARLQGYLGADGSAYETEGELFDRREFELNAGFQMTWPRRSAYLELLGGASYRAGEKAEEWTGIGTGLQWRMTSGLTTVLQFEAKDVDIGTDIIEEANRYLMSAKLVKPFGGRGETSLHLTLQHQNALDRDDLDFNWGELRLGHSVEIAGGWRIEPSIFGQKYQQLSESPGLGMAREETEYGVDLRVQKTDTFIFGRLTPFIEVGYSTRSANIDVYSYEDKYLNLGLTSAF